MLILTRNIGESFIINDETKILILGIKGNQARIGIDAPLHVSVNREEIQIKINEARKEAQENGSAMAEFVPGLIEKD